MGPAAQRPFPDKQDLCFPTDGNYKSFSHQVLNEQLWTVLVKLIRMGLKGKETKF